MEYRTYSNEHSAKRALRKEGLQLLPVEFELVQDNGRARVRPVLKCELSEDVREIQSRGFKAVKVEEGTGAPTA